MATSFKVVVYINGYRFDPISVSASFAVNEVCQFQIDMPPVPEWDLLLPRSHGAVFFLDPNTNTYRLMCEGEYVGYSRTKGGTGRRTRGLVFRGLHGFMEDTNFVNMVGVIGPTADANGLAALTAASARANGSLIAQGTEGHPYKMVGIQQIIENVSKSGNVTSAFIEIPRRLIAQTPVESFYFWARRMDRKMWTFLDEDLKAAMDYQRWNDLLQNTVNTMGLGPNTLLMEVLQRYEETAFYHHIAMPAPPLYKTGSTPSRTQKADDATAVLQTSNLKLDISYSFFIPEMFFAPYLFNTIPPACNTLFNDQLRSVSGTLAFAAVPTRFIGQLTPPAGITSALPLLYMANNQYAVENVSKASPKVGALQQITQGMFSDEELIRGVRSVHGPIRFEKLQQGGDPKDGIKGPQATLQTTIELMMRHEFNKARGTNRVLQITSVFQPYLVPGFPIVVEDGNQPFRAMVQSVSHSMTADGQPSTSIVVTHVEELFQLGTASRTAPLPAYLNHIYAPADIAKTYAQLFGTNLTAQHEIAPYATCVPPEVITEALKTDIVTQASVSVGGYVSTSAQVNLDTLLASVVDVPQYTETGTRLGHVPAKYGSAANRLRLSQQPHEAFLQFQYRSGCTLRNWMIMHNLRTSLVTSEADIDQHPPDNIGNTLTTEGDDVFGHPSWLTMDQDPSSLNTFFFEFPQYGAYKAVVRPSSIPNGEPQAIISPHRQKLTASIQSAILRMATNDTKLATERNIEAATGERGDFNPRTPSDTQQA